MNNDRRICRCGELVAKYLFHCLFYCLGIEPGIQGELTAGLEFGNNIFFLFHGELSIINITNYFQIVSQNLIGVTEK
jgi:hypothetical protein